MCIRDRDKAAIEARSADLMTASQKLGEKMYADQQASAAAAGAAGAAGASAAAGSGAGASGPGAAGGARSADDDVIDAEVKEVKKD